MATKKPDTKNLVICGFFTSLICVCSLFKITLPFTPVPVTLQTFAVSVAGICLGKKYGLVSVVTYILLGAIGIPVFSGMNSGLGYLSGATGGFIFGFVACVFVIGFVYEKINNITAAIILGNIALYICGAAWYMNFSHISFIKSFMLTVLPFIPADLFKMFLAFTVSKIFVTRKFKNGWTG